MKRRMIITALLLFGLLGTHGAIPTQAAGLFGAQRFETTAASGIRAPHLILGKSGKPDTLIKAIVALQAPRGRQAAVMVSSADFQEYTMDHPGALLAFSAPAGSYTLTAVADCHLPAATKVKSPSADHRVMLLAGDVTGNNRIDINDLASIGREFGNSGVTGCANLDGDLNGSVNILDLTLAAVNLGKSGPTNWD